MLAAMPAMKAASNPVIASPSKPLGSRSRMRYSRASLYVGSAPVATPETDLPAFRSAISVTSTAAIMPGMMVMNGTNIFGNAPMIGVRRAELIESDAIARCTSTKFVVQ
jgi:hypothetical protein